jgi:hypothetical protein
MRHVMQRLMSVMTAITIILGGLVLTYVAYAAMNNMPVRQYLPNEKTNAVWEWRNILGLSKSAPDTALYLKKHQINTVYLDISGALQNMNSQSKEEYNEALNTYISVLNSQKIRVFASGGDVTWSKPELRGAPIQLMDYVFEFNKNNDPVKFSGIEYDIESYNQEEFEPGTFTDKSIILSELLDTVDVLASEFEAKLKNKPDPAMELGFAVPYWFDNQNKNIKSVRWKDKTGPAIYHILDRLNTVQRANVVVMAYRNAARGNNGTIALSRTEVQYAQYKASRVQVIVGQEVGDVEPEKITFFGKSKTEMSQEITWIEEQFANSPTYGGIAINDLQAYEQLTE